MTLRLEAVELATNSADREGRLVFADDLLVAVLVRLSDHHGDDAGKWFMEVGFGAISDRNAPLFFHPEEAAEWITRRLSARQSLLHRALHDRQST